MCVVNRIGMCVISINNNFAKSELSDRKYFVSVCSHKRHQ